MRNKKNKIAVCSIGLITLIVLMIVMICYFVDDNQNKQSNVGDYLPDSVRLDGLMGVEAPDGIKTLDVADIKEVDLKYDRAVNIQKAWAHGIIDGTLMDVIKNDESLWWDGKTGCYISLLPIFMFDAYNKEYENEAMLLVFSEDKELLSTVNLYLVNGELKTTCELVNPYIWELVQDKPDEQYILIHNSDTQLLLQSNNIIIKQTYDADEYTVSGDYYHALNDELLGFSYSKVTDSRYLVWVEAE